MSGTEWGPASEQHVHSPTGELRAERPGFTTRLLVSQTLVLVAMTLTSWLVASVVGPGIFHDHLEKAGVAHGSSETDHVKQAFASAMLLALLVALLTATLLALGVTWYFSRQVQRSISRVVDSAASIAAGDYSSRIPSPGLGGEFDELARTFNSLAERLEVRLRARDGACSPTSRTKCAPPRDTRRTPRGPGGRRQRARRENTIRPAIEHGAARPSRSGHERGLAGRRGQPGRPPRAVGPSTTCVLPWTPPAREYVDKGVHLREEVTTDARAVLVDPTRMGQIWATCSTTRCDTHPGGTVTVSCHLRSG